MAAIRTMPGQTPHTPLQAYMDEKSVQDHVRPWQQILMFIARTQTGWLWQGKQPTYIMTRRQRKTWHQLWQAARQVVQQGTAVPDDARASPDPMEMSDEGSELPARVAGFQMAPVEIACLEFCIGLLNRKIKVREYESALVCSMAVLGRGRRSRVPGPAMPQMTN